MQCILALATRPLVSVQDLTFSRTSNIKYNFDPWSGLWARMSIWLSSALDCSVLGWHCWQLQHCFQVQHFVNNQKSIISDKFLVVYKMLDLSTMLQLWKAPLQNTAVPTQTDILVHKPAPDQWFILIFLCTLSLRSLRRGWIIFAHPARSCDFELLFPAQTSEPWDLRSQCNY